MRSSSETDHRATMLFFRKFTRVRGLTVMSGGHRKVWDYFEHVEQSPQYRPVLRTPDLPLADDNPWSARSDAVIGPRTKVHAQVHFLAGMNWSKIPPPRRAHPDIPVINLVQHIRHAKEDDPKRAFLQYPAIRICVSPEVTAAITATGIVRGPVITIPNGIDIAVDLAKPLSERDIDIAIIGNKRPDVAREIAARLEKPGRRLHLLARFEARQEFLDVLSRARLAVFVPRLREGFYLPALEAMALGTVVVCPDSEGNRSFCRDGETCWFPANDVDAIVSYAEAAWAAAPEELERIRQRAAMEASGHDLAGERRAFLEVLADLPALWAEAIGHTASPG